MMSTYLSCNDRRAQTHVNAAVTSRCLAIVLAQCKRTLEIAETPVFERVSDFTSPISSHLDTTHTTETTGGSKSHSDEDGRRFKYSDAATLECNVDSTSNVNTYTRDTAALNGNVLFDEFILRNKACYWNPALVESIRCLEYIGFVQPSTLLVRADDVHLENLRTAWGRCVLKPPNGFSIQSIGDVSGIQMQVIPQTQFIPLPEALCLIIMDLNNNRVTATLDIIRDRLQQCYGRKMQLPNDQLLYDTLGHLIHERKVFHTGSGYFVVTPDTYRLRSDDPSTIFTTMVSHNPMYIPVNACFPRMPMRSISCQADMEDDINTKNNQYSRVQRDVTPAARKTAPCNNVQVEKTQSMKTARNKENVKKGTGSSDGCDNDVKRTISMRTKGNKYKDVNLKNSNLNQEKDKGEKTSLLSKLFGKGKKKSACIATTVATDTATCPPPASAPPTLPEKETGMVEHATFSAQFPPPEWKWYQQQVEKHRRVEEWVHKQIPKSHTWHHNMQTTNPAVSACLNPYSHCRQPISDFSQQHTGTVSGADNHVAFSGGDNRVMMRQDVRTNRPSRTEAFVRNSENFTDNYEQICDVPRHERKSHNRSRSLTRNERGVRLERLTKEQDNVKNVMDKYDLDTSYSEVSHVKKISPDQTFVTFSPGEFKTDSNWPLHSSPFPKSSAKNSDSYHRDMYQPSNAKDKLMKNDLGQKPQMNKFARRAHKARRRQLRRSCVPEVSFIGYDIQYEYHGHRRKRNTDLSKSRDSGVNCIGLKQSEDLHKGRQLDVDEKHYYESVDNQGAKYGGHSEVIASSSKYDSLKRRHRKAKCIKEETEDEVNVDRSIGDADIMCEENGASGCVYPQNIQQVSVCVHREFNETEPEIPQIKVDATSLGSCDQLAGTATESEHSFDTVISPHQTTDGLRAPSNSINESVGDSGFSSPRNPLVQCIPPDGSYDQKVDVHTKVTNPPPDHRQDELSSHDPPDILVGVSQNGWQDKCKKDRYISRSQEYVHFTATPDTDMLNNHRTFGNSARYVTDNSQTGQRKSANVNEQWAAHRPGPFSNGDYEVVGVL